VFMPFTIFLKRWWNQSVLWFSLALVSILIILPLGLFLWLLFSTTIFTIQTVTVVDARPHTTEAVKKITTDLVGKNIFSVLPEALEKRIVSELPHVRTVHITRKLPGIIKVVVQEKTPVLLLFTGGNYYFVDAGGIVYEEARLDTLPGTVLPVVKNTDTHLENGVVLGGPAMEQQFVEFVVEVQRQLPERLNFRVAEIRIPSLSAREVTFVLENNWLIRFDTSRAARSQIAVLVRLLDEIVNGEERASLEYVDLRIPNRVYYKTTRTNLETKISP
jgi:cell division septal protein FtsQ